jgi:hypothetical protein
VLSYVRERDHHREWRRHVELLVERNDGAQMLQDISRNSAAGNQFSSLVGRKQSSAGAFDNRVAEDVRVRVARTQIIEAVNAVERVLVSVAA